MITDKCSISNNKTLHLVLFGEFQASTSGAIIQLGYAKLRALLAFLALAAGTPQRRAYLTELLWPEMDEETGRQNLRRALFNLKVAMGAAGEMIATTRETVTLLPDGLWLDVAQFTEPSPSCPPAPTPAHCTRCLSDMEDTMAGYRGEFMAGFSLHECPEFEEWLQMQRETLQSRALALLEKIAQCHEQAGNHARALPYALRITELAPWNDAAQQRVMRCYAMNGQHSAALAQYTAYARVLQNELGVLPDDATRQLAERMRNGELTPPAPKVPSQPVMAQILTERRQVTVLYIELTPLSSDDPDEAMESLRAPQERCQAIIRQFSGHTVQMHGGGLLVYFGYPHAQEHAARHAVQAALAISRNNGHDLQVRSGIHTGLVISSNSNSIPDTVGRTSRIAIQLRSHAGPGEVVISRQTHDLVRGYFDSVALVEHCHIDGVPPVEIFHAVRENGIRTRLDAAAQLTPMVGRKTEIALLMKLWNRAATGPRQIVLVQGDAGIGKSRLLHTLKQQLRRQPHEIRELLCFPEYRQSPFHPMIAMLESLFSFAPGDSTETKSAKLIRHLETYFPSSAHETVPLLIHLLSLPESDKYPLPALSPQRLKEQTNHLLLDLLRSLTQQQPVLLVIEDLHWIDPSTLELLTTLIAQSGWRSLLVLLTSRHEFIPPWREALDTTLTLSPLNEEEAVKIVAAINSDLPEPMLLQILARTDGIPLFIEEMAKCCSSITGQTTIPATLHDLLAARMDCMGEAKYTAQIAATIGREFDFELLSRVASRSVHDTRQHLAELQRAGLIYDLNDSNLQFKHALIQEAAYQSQTKAGRRAVHLNIAQTLQAEFPEIASSQPEIIAQHLSAAGEIPQAIEFWIKAGQRAAHNCANIEAIEHFHAGLELLALLPVKQERDRTEFKIFIHLCPVLYAAQGYGSREATEANRRIAALSGTLGDSPELFLAKWAQVMNTIANAGSREVPPQASLLLEMAPHDALHRQAAHYAVANAAFWLGDFAHARDHARSGLALYRAEQHQRQLEQFGEDLSVSCMAYLCWSLYFLGFPQQAEQTCARMLDQARQMDHPHTLALALCFASVLHRWLHKPEETLTLSAETITVSRQHGFSVWLAAGEMTHGWALVMCNRDVEGINELRSSIARMRVAIGGISVVFLSALIEALAELKRYDEALEVIAQAYADIDATGDGHFTAEIHRLKGVCLLGNNSNDQATAESCFLQARELSRKQGAKSLELRAAISTARLWREQGRSEEGLHLLNEIYDTLTDELSPPPIDLR